MAYVPVTLAGGFTGKVTKKGLREAINRGDPVEYRVESNFHPKRGRIVRLPDMRGDTLEVHVNGASVAMVNADTGKVS